MKKFLVIIALTGMTFTSEAQSLPNSGFENWTNKVFYSNPNPYSTTNAQLYMGGAAPNVTRVSDAKSGRYALKLTNVQVNNDTMPGGLFLGNPGQGGSTGGFPYDQRPDSFGFFYKSQLSSIDSGIAVLFFKKNGMTMGISFISLTGNHSTYTRTCSEITFFDTSSANKPDTIVLVVFSGNPDKKAMPGSYLQLDSMFLTGVTKKLPNHSFETWQDVKAEEADGWMSSNSFIGPGSPPNVVKSTDKRTGIYSIKLTTAIVNFGNKMAFITNGNIAGEGGPKGGTAVIANPKIVSFWYKYTPAGKDTGIVLATTSRWNSAGDSTEKLEKQLVKLTPATNWTYKEVSFSYKNIAKRADTVMVAFAPSDLENNPDSAKVGSMLLIDDLNITYYPNSIKRQNMDYIQAWPVPATTFLNLSIVGFKGSNALLKIYSIGGILITEKSIEVKDGKAITDISNLPSGNYLTIIKQDGKDWRIPFVVRH